MSPAPREVIGVLLDMERDLNRTLGLALATVTMGQCGVKVPCEAVFEVGEALETAAGRLIVSWREAYALAGGAPARIPTE